MSKELATQVMPAFRGGLELDDLPVQVSSDE